MSRIGKRVNIPPSSFVIIGGRHGFVFVSPRVGSGFFLKQIQGGGVFCLPARLRKKNFFFFLGKRKNSV